MTVCEETEEIPDPAIIPIQFSDLDINAQLAWDYYNICLNDTVSDGINIAGFSFNSIKFVFDLYSVPVHRQKDIFEKIMYIKQYINQRRNKPTEDK